MEICIEREYLKLLRYVERFGDIADLGTEFFEILLDCFSVPTRFAPVEFPPVFYREHSKNLLSLTIEASEYFEVLKRVILTAHPVILLKESSDSPL
jgi:hypothetical protein